MADTPPLRTPAAATAGPRPPRVVALGASAGGLSALLHFFAQVQPHAALSYVVVQHLDPTQKAALAALLQRATRLPVCEARAEMPIQAGHVYVIPPNTELRVAGGLLHLAPPTEPRGLRTPINVLFSSLAQDQGAAAIGVVLSGMGSDGTSGLQAIRAVGGLALVQSPESAQFDAMPASAIAAGCADIVAAPEALPARIADFVARQDGQQEGIDPPPAGAQQDILGLLHRHTRHDFSLYKPSTVRRRIERRMAIHGLLRPHDYAALLRGNPQEIELLFKELLIGVTSFFRDPEMWQRLADVALPALLQRRAGEKRLRAWVVGCSTGEEAFTLAMVFADVVRQLPQAAGCTLQIFASDLSPDAIAAARLGRYPVAAVAGLGPERLQRHFTQSGGMAMVRPELRETVLFAQHDVLIDPPFTRLDILCCRNLLIYFDATLQRRLMPLFHYSLRPGGLLLLGGAETVGTFTTHFEPIDPKLRLYQRRARTDGAGAGVLLHSFPPLSRPPRPHEESALPPTPTPDADPDGLQEAADHVLLQTFSPPAVVVNGDGDIVYISGRTGRYLEPAAGKANWNFHAMVHPSLREPLARALHQAHALGDPVRLAGLRLADAADTRLVNVTAQPLHAPEALSGMTMIVFEAQPAPPRRRRRHAAGAPGEDDEQGAAYAAELQACREEIHSLREATRLSKEELRSANEELQATNEELQSTNEELTSSKEEMQSMNEELQTVNNEMQTRLDDLALAQSDLKTLLNSVDIAILFLDQKLDVRRYTDRAARIVSLRDSDIGRPLSELTNSLDYPTMIEDLRETMRTLVPSERRVHTTDRREFAVRIMPYRRLDNVIDGAVITFVEIAPPPTAESAPVNAAAGGRTRA